MRVVVGIGFALAGLAACSYNWDAAAGADGGPPDASGREAAVDATGGDVEVDAVVDGGADVEVDADAENDAPVDAPAEVSYCGNLEAQVANDKANALNCAGNLPCNSSVPDQCGCTVWVAQASSPATSTYVSDVKELQDSGCPLGCGSCPFPEPSGAYCLPIGGGAVGCTPHP